MSNFDSSTLKNVEITNQHLQQAGDAMKSVLYSNLKLGDNMLAIGQSVAEAVQLGYNDYKTACSTIVGNLPILAIGATVGLVFCSPVYAVLANAATCFVSHPIASLTLHTAYNFFIRTDGIENIKNTISSIGDVASGVVKVGTELYHASDSAINTAVGVIEVCLLNKVSDHNSEEINDETVNIEEYEINANQHAISAVGDSLSEVNTEEYDIISADEINAAAIALSGVAAEAA